MQQNVELFFLSERLLMAREMQVKFAPMISVELFGQEWCGDMGGCTKAVASLPAEMLLRSQAARGMNAKHSTGKLQCKATPTTAAASSLIYSSTLQWNSDILVVVQCAGAGRSGGDHSLVNTLANKYGRCM